MDIDSAATPIGRLAVWSWGLAIAALLVAGMGCGGGPPKVEGDDTGTTTGNDTGVSDTDDQPDTGTDDTGDGIVYDVGDTNRNPDCPDAACSPGSNRCKSESVSQTCVLTANGCGKWSGSTECRGDQVCQGGLCEEPTPCSTGNNDCSKNATCEVDDSTQKGYVCECSAGYVDYKGDGTVCYPDYYKLIESATFQMGSPSGETGRESDETRHQVEITSNYVINQHEILQADWGQIVGNDFPTQGVTECNSPPCPIFNVSWWAALFYANKLSKRHGLETCYNLKGCSGSPGRDYECSSVEVDASSVVDCKGYRLPTEAEWEYAARGDTQTATFHGDLQNETTDSTVGAIAWYDANSGGAPHENMAKTLNDYGLGDTSGNVAEWVWDWKGSYLSSSVTDPTGPNSGSARVVRGGHYASPAHQCRSAARNSEPPTTRSRKIGFRIVRTLPPK